MNLEEFKATWKQLDDNERPGIPAEKIKEMISINYRRRLRRVILPEVFFGLVYAYFAFLIFNFFAMLDTGFMAGLGGVTVVFLLVIPALRFYLLRKLYGLGSGDRPYGQHLRAFAKYKLRYLTIRRAQAGIGFLLLIAVAVLTTRIYNEQALTESKYFWAVMFSIGFLAVQGINYYLLRRSRKAMDAAEDLLLELDKT